MRKPRILVLDDEFMLAMMIEEELIDAGYDVLGPFTRISDARDALESAQCDGAILDINLGGSPVYPFAEELMSRSVPLVFVSGYGTGMVPDKFAHLPRLEKPHPPGELLRKLAAIISTQ